MKKKISLLASALAVCLYCLGSRSQADTPAANPAPDAPWKYRFQQNNAQAGPVELTASDGSGLALKLYQAKTVMQGPLAFTELRLTFANPENRVREGRFRITLPNKAAISRFAMRIDDKWQEAEVVERQAARQAYEDFLHRRQDPALLEKEAGNEFRARVFPIPANGEKELIISYSQELESAQDPYTLKLAGLPRIQDFEVEVQLLDKGQPKKLQLREKDYTPPGDFQVVGGPRRDSVLAGGLLVTRVTPQLDAEAADADKLLVLIDTSASRALGRKEQLAKLQHLLGQWKGLKEVSLIAFDQEVVPLSSGSPAELDWGKLQQRDALGATDLEAALKWAARQKAGSRLLLVTDGIATAGSTQLLESLKGDTFERVDVLLTGGINDPEKMESLARRGGKHEGIVIKDSLDAGLIEAALVHSVASGLEVKVENAAWSWPATLDMLQPGQSRLIYAQMADGFEGPVTLNLAGRSQQIQPAAYDSSALLERSLAIAQVSKLEAELSESKDPELRNKLSKEIVDLSTKKRVLSDLTALLVLETEQDYARFHIDRKALAGILSVGPEGLRYADRTEFATTPVPNVAEKELDKPDLKDGVAQGGDLEKASEESVVGDADGSRDQPASLDDSSRTDGQLSQSRAQEAPATALPQANRPAPETIVGYIARQPVATGASERRAANGSEQLELESRADDSEPENKLSSGPALSGEFAAIDKLLKAGKQADALKKARLWLTREPGNVLALVAVGNCLEALHQYGEAARVFGSIIDLFPSRADLRRYAGGRLETLGQKALSLAVDSFEKAVEQRPDHVSSHRFLAFALARQGRYGEALEACEAGLSRRYPDGRFRSYERILKDDLGLLAAAWLAAEPARKDEVYARLKKYGAEMAGEPSVRFVLTWETDANDVDFHIRDKKGGHAYYSQPALASGGELYGDVTTGYGPECFAIPGKGDAYPYKVDIHYYSRGPMGYGMGQLEILRHDGKGHLSFEERPYLIMEDNAYVSLGEVDDGKER